MKNRTGLILLILICAGLSAALIWNQRRSSARRSTDSQRINYYSNKLVQTSGKLDEQRQVNTGLEGDLKKQRESYHDLTNDYTRVSADLELARSSLTSTRQQLVRREAQIADLQSQNQALDERALDLSNAITNLTTQINETRQKLAASEGDKAFLEKELQRLMAEKAELERQFNDLAVLRAQVSKLKEEMSISRRLRWIREGLFARADQKGAQLLMQKSPAVTNQPAPQPTYDLNVEVSADGSVRVIPPKTNNPAATNASPSSATNSSPAQ